MLIIMMFLQQIVNFARVSETLKNKKAVSYPLVVLQFRIENTSYLSPRAFLPPR